MRIRQTITSGLALTALVASVAFAATSVVPITVQQNGKPLSGATVSLELADLGKAAASPTDANGNTSLALEMANAGKVEVSVYVDEKCPNGETRVVLAGPDGGQKSECRERRKIGAFWWTGSGRVTIDVGMGTVAIEHGESSALNPSALNQTPRERSAWTQGWSLGAGLGYMYFSQLDCGSTSGCVRKKGTGSWQLEVGRQVGPIEIDLDFSKSFGTVGSRSSSPQSNGGQYVRIRQEWRVSAAYPFALGNNLTLYPFAGVTHVEQATSGGVIATQQTCFDVGNGQISCETGPASGGTSSGRASASTTRAFGGAGIDIGISGGWSMFARVLFEDNNDFGALDSPRFGIDIGVKWRSRGF